MDDKKIRTSVSDFEITLDDDTTILLKYVLKEVETSYPDTLSEIYVEAYVSEEIAKKLWRLDVPLTPKKITRDFLVIPDEYINSRSEYYDLTGRAITDILVGSWFERGAPLFGKSADVEYFLRMTLKHGSSKCDECLEKHA